MASSHLSPTPASLARSQIGFGVRVQEWYPPVWGLSLWIQGQVKGCSLLLKAHGEVAPNLLPSIRHFLYSAKDFVHLSGSTLFFKKSAGMENYNIVAEMINVHGL